MKKALILAVMFLFAGNLFAQVEEIQKSQERIAKILKLEKPANCKGEKINSLATECSKVAEALKTTAPLLHKYYYSLNGKAEDGTDNANVTKPSLEELAVLSKTIADESQALKKATELLPDATKELKDIKNPMQLKGTKKAYDYSQSVLQIAAEENTAELQLIAKMIEQASK